MSAICPVCERLVMEPPPAQLRSASWGECACTDDGACVAHECDPTDMPQRPDPRVLMERARAIHKQRVAHYERMLERIASATTLEQRLAALEATVARVDVLLDRWDAEHTMLCQARDELRAALDGEVKP